MHRHRPRAALIMQDPRRALVYADSVMQRLDGSVEWVAPPLNVEEHGRHPERTADAEVLFTGWGAPRLDGAFLAQHPGLGAVFYAAGSVKGVVTDEFWRSGIPIVSSAAANAIPVAEYAFAEIVLGLKQARRISREVDSARGFVDKTRIGGAASATVGLVSLGEIGRRVIERLATLDVSVIAYDPVIDPARARALGVRLADLPTVFAESDVVSLHAPLLRETTGMIDGGLLSAMKFGATLINTARGAIVREDDLIRTLRARPDLTAVLDVTAPEPPDPRSWLYTAPNVVLTGHIAGSQGRECTRLGMLVADELERFVAGEPLVHAVSPALSEVSA